MTHVTAAIIRRNGKILICQRAEGGSCAWLWEFPGGKVEKGETPEHSLIRECREELGLDIYVKGVFAEKTWKYPEREIAFTFYYANITGGELRMNAHNAICWVSPQELKNYTFCPADVEIAERLENERALYSN